MTTDRRTALLDAAWEVIDDHLTYNRLGAALDLALEEAAKAAFEACACNGAAAAIRALKGEA